MGDACTGAPTFTSFSASTEQTFSVSQSTSHSLSIGDPSTIPITLAISGTDVVVTESTIPGATGTVDIVVPVTVTAQRVVSVPVLTLFAPCSTTETSTSISTPTSTPDESTSTTTSSSSEPTSTSNSRTSVSNTRTSEASSSASVPESSSDRQNPSPTPSSTRPGSSNNSNPSETGTIITTTSVGLTTLPNGSQSTFVATVTTSIAPNGTLNGNDYNGSGGGAGSSRAIAIGVGVAGGIVALIILIIGITWHIRRKRRNSLEPFDETNIWGPDREYKMPQASADPRPAVIPEYTYNPYGEGRTTSYAPVPTMSPPRARPMSLSASGHTPQTSVSSGGNGGLVVAPSLARLKTADEILYEAAREGLPQSRTASVTTRGYGSLTASSHMTHSGRSDSVVGLLESHGEGRAGHGHDELGQRVDQEEDRPTSPVSIMAPKLAIVNPDADRDP